MTYDPRKENLFVRLISRVYFCYEILAGNCFALWESEFDEYISKDYTYKTSLDQCEKKCISLVSEVKYLEDSLESAVERANNLENKLSATRASLLHENEQLRISLHNALVSTAPEIHHHHYHDYGKREFIQGEYVEGEVVELKHEPVETPLEEDEYDRIDPQDIKSILDSGLATSVIIEEGLIQKKPGGGYWFRRDFDETQNSSVVLQSCYHFLLSIGAQFVDTPGNPQVEHDCISGDIFFTES